MANTRWTRIVIEMEASNLSVAGTLKWVQNVISGEDGEITVEPAEAAMTPWTIQHRVEEYDAPEG